MPKFEVGKSQVLSDSHAEVIPDKNVRVVISVPGDLRVQMIRLSISPTNVAKRAFEKEVKRRLEIERLARARVVDPRLELNDIRKPNKRTLHILGE